MKLVNIRSARAIWLVPLNDLNKRGRFLLPAVGGLIERYSFQKPPSEESLVTSPTKVAFEVGSFNSADGVPIYVNLTVHDDGFVVDTRASTEEADRFLQDALAWLSSEFQLPQVSDLAVRKLFVSEVTVVFDHKLAVFHPAMERFSSSLNFKTFSKPLALSRIVFSSDPSESKQTASLRIERELDTPFADNRYYSYAGTTTTEHLALLEAFERAAQQ